VLACDLDFRIAEIELHAAAAAFLPQRRFDFIRNESIEKETQKRAEARLRRVVRRQRSALETLRQKRLRQVLGIRNFASARDAQVLVQRLPIERDEGVEGAPALIVIIAGESSDHTAASGREHWREEIE